MKDKKWGGALEHILGGRIRTFCVHSPEDSRKLFAIMGQVSKSSFNYYCTSPIPVVSVSAISGQKI